MAASRAAVRDAAARMRKLLLTGLVLAAVYFGGVETGFIPARQDGSSARGSDQVLATAFENRQSDIQVQASGRVARVLPDDNDGSRHQRFIVQLASGQTVLVAHNIDLADRIAALEAGDLVELNGEYEWNERGGVIHWTHRDPQHSHADGWVKHNGHTYQ
jgi:hypothetical protein